MTDATRRIDKALDKAEQALERLDAIHGADSAASADERLGQAAESSELLSSVWATPPSERLKFGDGWRLADAIGGATPGFHGDKADGERFIRISADQIARYQRLLYANGLKGARNRVLIILQGMDASGKGSLVKHVFRQGNPMGIHYHGFGAPSEEERAHDFLWRVERELPRPGWIAVFDRSHYEDVVMPHVWGTLPEEEWRPRYGRIVDFERDLAQDGCAIIKIFLAVSPEEQLRHFLGRLDDPTKHWKFAMSDLDARDRWDDYMAAWQEVFECTSTDFAPWHVVPADNRWYSRAVVSELLRDAIVGMNLAWPGFDADVDLGEVRRRLEA
ncbi:PPK2 family polyphosphate kinase [Bifidobacterium vespertilionis]|uniref:Polyphosphate kinase 2 family protein n=1 Tax=Bifidobacterium vespertilionis TaxID=2562524 RepID=A0A5J5DZP6_9BIFI|nr:PPK2 family polyphosphate kinase [Bifidobacterium vespertilionis]KAA8820077.1 polyphosphate kinase 2 family protein [Bifidobacterium vespertilionis]KAA8822232.1 polyphosphate kinase 2 family protein [Bifidobacterium vespertilionis]